MGEQFLEQFYEIFLKLFWAQNWAHFWPLGCLFNILTESEGVGINWCVKDCYLEEGLASHSMMEAF